MTEPITTDQGALVLTQRVAAPRDVVFEFFVDPRKMVRWMGTTADLEPEPGGTFHVNVNGTDIASGSYVEVDPPNRVVFTWGWEASDDVPPGSSTVTVTLTTHENDTIVELRHEGLPGGSGDQHRMGWTHYLARLRAVSAGEDPGPDSLQA